MLEYVGWDGGFGRAGGCRKFVIYNLTPWAKV